MKLEQSDEKDTYTEDLREANVCSESIRLSLTGSPWNVFGWGSVIDGPWSQTSYRLDKRISNEVDPSVSRFALS